MPSSTRYPDCPRILLLLKCLVFVPSGDRFQPPSARWHVRAVMEDEADASPRSRLSDPLSRLSDVPGSSCSSWSGGSNPGSPRLPPRRPSHSPPLHRADVDWQERCMELQLELHRYRHQAASVRDMLNDKVTDNRLYKCSCRVCRLHQGNEGRRVCSNSTSEVLLK